MGGVDPALRRHVYQAVVWVVLSYGLPLWYRLDGKGCRAHLKLLSKTQNVALCWISRAFRTTPIHWMEFLAGIPPVRQKANYMLRNVLQHVSRLPVNHILHSMAAAPVVHLFKAITMLSALMLTTFGSLKKWLMCFPPCHFMTQLLTLAIGCLIVPHVSLLISLLRRYLTNGPPPGCTNVS